MILSLDWIKLFKDWSADNRDKIEIIETIAIKIAPKKLRMLRLYYKTCCYTRWMQLGFNKGNTYKYYHAVFDVSLFLYKNNIVLPGIDGILGMLAIQLFLMVKK